LNKNTQNNQFNKMHILVVIDSLNFGGAERQVVLDANALVRQGHLVSVAYFRPGPLDQQLDLSVIQNHIKSKSFAGRIFTFSRLISRIKPDLIMAHMFRAEIVSAFAGLASRVPVIFNEHGLGLWKKLHHKLAFRFSALFAREIWCASDACRTLRIEKDQLKPEKVRTVYNFFDLKLGHDPDYTLRTKILSDLDKPSDIPIIGFVGRFDPVKRLEILIDAAKQDALQEAIFVLVGDGEQREKLEQTVSKSNLNDRFFFSGYVSSPGVYFEVFDIFVLPSSRESLSVALLEAGSASLPSVAFDVGGNAEIIENQVTGYVVPDGDFAAFHKALALLVQSRELRHEMGGVARKRVENMFSEQRRMDEILSAAERYG
jgi:glycosyltransferase involved in cell wall biosynthesis